MLPWHFTVQPPPGHLIAHVLLPVHVTVDPLPSETLQSLPPPHVTVLFVPVVRLQVLVPLHVEVQFDAQVPTHVDWPEQSVVQPVPHEELHVFFVWQSKVALSGGATLLEPPSAPPSAPVALALPPKAQVPPVLQVHVAPEQSQSPVHDGLGTVAFPLLPPHPVAATEPMAEKPTAKRASARKRGFMRVGFHEGRRTRQQADTRRSSSRKKEPHDREDDLPQPGRSRLARTIEEEVRAAPRDECTGAVGAAQELDAGDQIVVFCIAETVQLRDERAAATRARL